MGMKKEVTKKISAHALQLQYLGWRCKCTDLQELSSCNITCMYLTNYSVKNLGMKWGHLALTLTCTWVCFSLTYHSRQHLYANGDLPGSLLQKAMLNKPRIMC
jgi:hypothetical protein